MSEEAKIEMLRSVGHLINEEDRAQPALRYFLDTVLPPGMEKGFDQSEIGGPQDHRSRMVPQGRQPLHRRQRRSEVREGEYLEDCLPDRLDGPCLGQRDRGLQTPSPVGPDSRCRPRGHKGGADFRLLGPAGRKSDR